jgi:hypothetical protein
MGYAMLHPSYATTQQLSGLCVGSFFPTASIPHPHKIVHRSYQLHPLRPNSAPVFDARMPGYAPFRGALHK